MVSDGATQIVRGEIAFPKTGVKQVKLPRVQDHMRSNRAAPVPIAGSAAAQRLAHVRPFVAINRGCGMDGNLLVIADIPRAKDPETILMPDDVGGIMLVELLRRARRFDYLGGLRHPSQF